MVNRHEIKVYPKGRTKLKVALFFTEEELVKMKKDCLAKDKSITTIVNDIVKDYLATEKI